MLLHVSQLYQMTYTDDASFSSKKLVSVPFEVVSLHTNWRNFRSNFESACTKDPTNKVNILKEYVLKAKEFIPEMRGGLDKMLEKLTDSMADKNDTSTQDNCFMKTCLLTGGNVTLNWSPRAAAELFYKFSNGPEFQLITAAAFSFHTLGRIAHCFPASPPEWSEWHVEPQPQDRLGFASHIANGTASHQLFICGGGGSFKSYPIDFFTNVRMQYPGLTPHWQSWGVIVGDLTLYLRLPSYMTNTLVSATKIPANSRDPHKETKETIRSQLYAKETDPDVTNVDGMFLKRSIIH